MFSFRVAESSEEEQEKETEKGINKRKKMLLMLCDYEHMLAIYSIYIKQLSHNTEYK